MEDMDRAAVEQQMIAFGTMRRLGKHTRQERKEEDKEPGDESDRQMQLGTLNHYWYMQ